MYIQYAEIAFSDEATHDRRNGVRVVSHQCYTYQCMLSAIIVAWIVPLTMSALRRVKLHWSPPWIWIYLVHVYIYRSTELSILNVFFDGRQRNSKLNLFARSLDSTTVVIQKRPIIILDRQIFDKYTRQAFRHLPSAVGKQKKRPANKNMHRNLFHTRWRPFSIASLPRSYRTSSRGKLTRMFLIPFATDTRWIRIRACNGINGD